MGFFELVALGAAVGVDTLSVSVGIGVSGISRRRLYQLGSAFTMTTASLFALGCALAIGLQRLVQAIPRHMGLNSLNDLSPDALHYIADYLLAFLAGAILLGLGLHLLLGRGSTLGERSRPLALRGIWGLLWLTTLVGIDAGSAGLSLGMMSTSQVLEAVMIVGAVNGSMSFLGLGLGRRLGILANGKLRPVGGLILIGLAARLLVNVLY